MKIVFAIIPPQHRAEADRLAAALGASVDAGDTRRVDELTDALARLSASCATTLPLEAWEALNRRVRVASPGYETAYLLSPADGALLRDAAETGGYGALTELLADGFHDGCTVLQLLAPGDT